MPKAILSEQLESLIRTFAPTPPQGREGVIDNLIAQANKNDRLLDLAVVTLIAREFSFPKACRLLTNTGVPEQKIAEALARIFANLGDKGFSIKCIITIEEVPQHGPN